MQINTINHEWLAEEYRTADMLDPYQNVFCGIKVIGSYIQNYNDYYEINQRCGCMYCPMSSYLNFAYLYKYYPDNFQFMIEKMRETEELRERAW